MYQEHFGLTSPLVTPGIARDAQVFTGTRRLGALGSRLAAALTRGNALVLLSGPAGVGKTTLAAHAIRTHATRLALGWIAHAPGRPHELLEQLLVEFGVAPEQLSRAGLLQIWQQFLNEMAVTETSVCVLVENADGLDAGVLRALESLTSADPSGCPGANLLLISRTSLVERLRRPGLEGLAQRVNANLRLEPLDEPGTADYLAFALAACGGRLEQIADPGAVRALHERSGGIIRVIANLADAALALAAERGQPRLDAALVDEIAADLAGGTPLQATPDLPVLTDAVDTPDDALVRDVLASERVMRAADGAAGVLGPVSAADNAAPTVSDTAGRDDGAPVVGETAHAAAAPPVVSDAPGDDAPAPPVGGEPAVGDAAESIGDDGADTVPAVGNEPAAGDAAESIGDDGADTAPAVGNEIVLETIAATRRDPRRAPDAEPEPCSASTDDSREAEPDAEDEEAETFEGLANALEFEDFSNLVAERLFGEDELDDLSQTLAVASTQTHRKLTGT